MNKPEDYYQTVIMLRLKGNTRDRYCIAITCVGQENSQVTDVAQKVLNGMRDCKHEVGKNRIGSGWVMAEIIIQGENR